MAWNEPLWERQRLDGELEPNMWYDRFTRYRLMGPSRSLLGCANQWRDENGRERSNYTPGSWRRNSEKWDWDARAEAWDKDQRQERIKVFNEKRKEMLKRHTNLGLAMQQVGGQKLKTLAEESPDQLSPREARQLIRQGIDIERTARGLPVWLLTIVQMSDKELTERYAELSGKAGAGSPSRGGA